MTPFLRGVLCGLVWMVAPAAGAQETQAGAPASQPRAAVSTGTEETRVTVSPEVKEDASCALEECEPRRPARVIRRPSRPVVTLDAGGSTWPIEARVLESAGPTVDVGSMTTGVRVDQEFLQRIVVRPGVKVRMAREDAAVPGSGEEASALPEVRLRRFQSLAELAPGTPEQLLLEYLVGRHLRDFEASVVSR